MATWQMPTLPIESRVASFVSTTGIDALCAQKLRKQGRAVIEQVLMKQRWGRNTSNASAVVSGEINHAIERLSRPPDEELERFLDCTDERVRRIDVDCANYVRAVPFSVHAGMVWKGWPVASHVPSLARMARVRADGSFELALIEQFCPGMLAELRRWFDVQTTRPPTDGPLIELPHAD
eukprot:15442508-Alexandrium_andersonii.AAC.1